MINIYFTGNLYCSAKLHSDGSLTLDSNRIAAEVKLTSSDDRVLHVTLDGTQLFKFYTPKREYGFGAKKPIEHLSVSGDIRGQVHDQNLVGVWSNEMSTEGYHISTPPFINLSGIHAGDVYFLKFFPSGKVALTGGADTTLRIWDIVDYDEQIKECDAMLGGTHTLGVLSADFIDRGRNIVSSSRDGSIALWDVPTQKCLRTMDKSLNPINSVHIINHNIKNLDATGQNTVIASSDQGEVYFYDVRTKVKQFKLKVPAPINEVSSHDQTIVCGTQTGSIYSWDLRNLSENTLEEKNVYNRKNTTIYRIQHLKDATYIVGSSEGAYLYDAERNQSRGELSGSRENKTKGVGYNQKYVYAGSSDGVVRSYSLQSIL